MQKIAILYDASQAILSTFDLDEVLAQILSIVRDYFQMQNAAILLKDEPTREFYVRTHFGRTGHAQVRLKVGEGIVGSAAVLKRPLYVPDVRRDARYIQSFTSTRSELAIPLMVRDEVVGVLDLQSDTANFFDAETIDLLTLFSTQASIALENARLYSMEQRRTAQLEAINAIARQTTAVTDIDHLLQKVCSLVLENFHMDEVAVLLMEDNNLFLRAHEGKLTPRITKDEMIPEAAGLCALALATGRPVLENDVHKVPHYLAGFEETQSEMCLPLVYFGEKLGVLVIESAKANAFDEEDIKPLQSVADICAAAIQNARFFKNAENLAYLDGLTGIFNRRFFEMRIAQEVERAQRYETGLSVIMVDIDHFKRLNDEFGHLLGDEVLKQVSVLFGQQLRKADVVCRYGGEEFAILLTQTVGEDALEVAEKLRRTVEGWHFPGVPRPVTISAGVAEFPDFGKSRDEIVAAADGALYAAKVAGRNRVMNAQQPRKTSA